MATSTLTARADRLVDLLAYDGIVMTHDDAELLVVAYEIHVATNVIPFPVRVADNDGPEAA